MSLTVTDTEEEIIPLAKEVAEGKRNYRLQWERAEIAWNKLLESEPTKTLLEVGLLQRWHSPAMCTPIGLEQYLGYSLDGWRYLASPSFEGTITWYITIPPGEPIYFRTDKEGTATRRPLSREEWFKPVLEKLRKMETTQDATHHH